ncbi:MAG TPA: hypothetical protein VJP80_02170 [Candidatus Saccharimonadales bacterium]|nr:hypothetical protein [Candidatus Saccharimonadales bacterium]
MQVYSVEEWLSTEVVRHFMRNVTPGSHDELMAAHARMEQTNARLRCKPVPPSNTVEPRITSRIVY